MDHLNSQYKTGNNKLKRVDDGLTSTAYSVDIDDQADNNYAYDKIGNLISDIQGKITDINWTVYGKIRNIYKDDDDYTNELYLEFAYDAMGNRMMKKVVPYSSLAPT